MQLLEVQKQRISMEREQLEISRQRNQLEVDRSGAQQYCLHSVSPFAPDTHAITAAAAAAAASATS